MTTASVEFIEKLPKVELHIHIEGTLTPQLRFRLAKKHSIALKWTTEEEMTSHYIDSFDDALHHRNENGYVTFFDLYYGSMAVLLDEDDFYDLAMDYFRKAASTNVRYAEVFFDPQAHTRRGVPLEHVMNGLKRAKSDAETQLGVRNPHPIYPQSSEPSRYVHRQLTKRPCSSNANTSCASSATSQ